MCSREQNLKKYEAMAGKFEEVFRSTIADLVDERDKLKENLAEQVRENAVAAEKILRMTVQLEESKKMTDYLKDHISSHNENTKLAKKFMHVATNFVERDSRLSLGTNSPSSLADKPDDQLTPKPTPPVNSNDKDDLVEVLSDDESVPAAEVPMEANESNDSTISNGSLKTMFADKQQPMIKGVFDVQQWKKSNF